MRQRSYLLLIAFLAVYLAAGLREFALHMDVSDDSLWYYYAGSGVLDRSAFDREQAFLPTIKALAEDDITWLRVKIRAGYTGNYLIPTFVCFHVGHALARLAGPPADFIDILSAALYWGYLAALLAGALVGGLAFLASARSMQAPLLVALAAIAALDLLHVDGGLGVLSTAALSARELMAIGYRLVLIFIDPHYAIASFGAFARNQVIFLALGVYALRWSGKPALSYAFMIVLLLFHHSMAFLLLALLLAVDLVTRPQIFRRIPCAIAAGGALMLGVLREELWVGIGRIGAMVLIASAAVALLSVVALVLWLGRRRAAPSAPGPHARWVGIWRDKGVVASDVLGLSAVFIAVLLTAMVANRLAPPFNQQYFWSILPGRLFAMLRPLYFLAAAIWIGGWLGSRLGERRRPIVASIGIAALVALIATETALTPPLGAVRERMARHLQALDGSLDRPSRVFRTEDEPRYYFALVKSLDTGADYLGKMWSRP